MAREYFALPDDERIRMFIDDGRAFVGYCAETYDLIIIDAFDDDHIPRPLLTEEFLRECRERLSADGVSGLQRDRRGHRQPQQAVSKPVPVGSQRVAQRLGVSDRLGGRRDRLDAQHDRAGQRRRADPRANCSSGSPSRVDGMVTVPGFERFGEDLYRGSIRGGDVPVLTDPGRPIVRATGGADGCPASPPA